MHKSFCSFILLSALSCSQIKQTQSKPLQSAIPALHIVEDTSRFDLKISKLAIDVHVIGNMATTTFDITYYNGLDRILEGEFDFPLADGQTVSRYALDINGNLREGVVVEKAKARVAYENTVRQKIDPGLVEKTQGNNFRTRIYPIPAKGYKRVVIGIEQKLDNINQELVYQLPLEAKEKIDSFSITANVMHGEKPKMETDLFPGFFFQRSETGYEGEHEATSFAANHLFAFSIPFEDDAQTVYTETLDGKTYFYINGSLHNESKQKAKPSVIGLLWDISASVDKRTKEKNIALLENYLAKLNNVRLVLIPFHIAAQPSQEFEINNGDASALISKLKSFAHDGGTQLGSLDLTKYAVDEFLLFSDGLSTFGKKEMLLSDKPVMAINSSPSADYAYLKFIAQQTKGSFIDLIKLDVEKAAEQMNTISIHVLQAKINNGSIEDMIADIDLHNNSFSVAGILNSSEASLEIQFGFENNAAITKDLTVEKNENSAEGVAKIWASMQVNKLDLQFEKNKEAITALGKQFSIVTQNTSLLVLDRVEDYVEHEIVPPAELQKEYFALLKEKQTEKKDAMDEALQAMNDLKAWWNTNYKNKNKKPENDGTFERVETLSMNMQTSVDSTAVSHFSRNAPERELQSTQSATLSSSPISGAFDADKISHDALSEVTFREIIDLKKEAMISEINVTEWKPDVPYLKSLNKTTKQKSLATYLELRKVYHTQPSFFFDVAKWFFDKGQKEEALLILSNVAEMKLENPELLRMMAYQLLDMNEKELAVETFREILKLREEEPQAYRDLALALSEAGMYNEAIDNLYKVITEVWDERFSGIKSIALNEMNAIVSAHTEVNTAAIDSRFIYAMPVDVRITIDWNTNDSDIDLWVTDPKKEKCFYSNRETSIGGHISNDMTQGYGPEEFAVKKAIAGQYIIEANLYGDTRQTISGPITIRADLYTNFGTPAQQRKRINFRVTENKEVVKIGELKFGQ